MIFFNSRAYLNGITKEFKVGIFGSRSLSDKRVNKIIERELDKLNATAIITTAEPKGVCQVAQKVAKEYAYPLNLHFINPQYLAGAFEQRCKEVIEASDFIIFIHDGKSKGTINELNLYKKTGKPYHYEVLEVLEDSEIDISVDTNEDIFDNALFF